MSVISQSRLLVVLVSLCVVSCTEHKRLAGEVERTKKEFAEAQEQITAVQTDQGTVTRAVAAIKTDPVVRRGIPNLELQVRNLDESVQALTLERDALKSNLDETKKDLAKYQSSNL